MRKIGFCPVGGGHDSRGTGNGNGGSIAKMHLRQRPLLVWFWLAGRTGNNLSCVINFKDLSSHCFDPESFAFTSTLLRMSMVGSVCG